MRAAPKFVAPIFHDNICYEIQDDEVDRFQQSGGVLSAVNTLTGQECWAVKVYEMIYDPSYEKDVQEVYISSLELDAEPGLLRVGDERRRWYRVRMQDGAVIGSDPIVPT